MLLGLEGDSDEDTALYAFQEAERRGVPLHVLHSWTHRHVTPELPSPVPATSPGQEQLARQARAEDSVPRFSLSRLSERHPGIQVESRTVRTGPAARAAGGHARLCRRGRRCPPPHPAVRPATRSGGAHPAAPLPLPRRGGADRQVTRQTGPFGPSTGDLQPLFRRLPAARH